MYKPNRSMEREFAFAPGMREFLAERAKEGEKAVVAAAPRYRRPDAAEYKNSVVSGVRTTRNGFVGFVGSTDPFWHLPEFGAKHTRASAPLRSGLERVASRVRRTRR